MLIVALVLAVVSLAALVTAVVTSNELIAWGCIGFSALGVLLLIVDAIRDRNRRPRIGQTAVIPAELAAETTEVIAPVEYDDVDEDAGEVDAEDVDAEEAEDYPDEVIYDDPEHDEPSDDEPDYPIAAEAAAIHIVSAEELEAQEISGETESDVEAETLTDDSSDTVAGESSYIVTESPTDVSAIVIYPSEEHDGER